MPEWLIDEALTAIDMRYVLLAIVNRWLLISIDNINQTRNAIINRYWQFRLANAGPLV